jgi:N-dimethylarginine dimethylaminohydrolase
MRRGALPGGWGRGKTTLLSAPSGRKEAAMATAARNGEILHLWLRLLGWQLETDRDGDYTVGVGTHLEADGSTLRVGGCARDDGELALQLFEQAMLTYERVHDRALNQLTAA